MPFLPLHRRVGSGGWTGQAITQVNWLTPIVYILLCLPLHLSNNQENRGSFCSLCVLRLGGGCRAVSSIGNWTILKVPLCKGWHQAPHRIHISHAVYIHVYVIIFSDFPDILTVKHQTQPNTTQIDFAKVLLERSTAVFPYFNAPQMGLNDKPIEQQICKVYHSYF